MVEEAEITASDEPQEVQVSSNELVFMIGEGVVRDRQNLKRLQFLDKQIGIARQELLKKESLDLGQGQKIINLERVRASLNERVTALERQLHETATERDKYRNQLVGMATEIDVLRNELTEIKQRKPKRKIIKGGKHITNTARN